eukprot:jgi/Chrzof1/5691/Cz16g11250.t1
MGWLLLVCASLGSACLCACCCAQDEGQWVVVSRVRDQAVDVWQSQLMHLTLEDIVGGFMLSIIFTTPYFIKMLGQYAVFKQQIDGSALGVVGVNGVRHGAQVAHLSTTNLPV